MSLNKFIGFIFLGTTLAVGFGSVGCTKKGDKVSEVKELKTETLKKGEGTEAKAGDTVTVHYTGMFMDGKKFDSSLDRGQPFVFKLGQGQVIPGWDQGLVGMKVGEKRKLTIPPDL